MTSTSLSWGWVALQGPRSQGPFVRVPRPFRPGDPTNVVRQVPPPPPSERELDWVLIGPETPCVLAEKVVLSGLNTHQMVQ